MENSFYSRDDLLKMGFKSIGDNVFISKKTSFYNLSNIQIGNNVRIDDFCILSGKIIIKDFVHISNGVSMISGDAGIVIGNHSCISVKCSIFAISDDYSGNYLIGPMEDLNKRNVLSKEIIIEDYVVVGSNSVLLPGAYIQKGTAVGALSLVKTKLKPYSIYCGSPCRFLKERSSKFF